MKSFWRVFDYVWPQWHRLVIIFICAVLIGILFSLSFMTIAPLLKVMMGEEGLHGWIDREVCNWRYGMDFYVPDMVDISENAEVHYYLRITSIDEGSFADKKGLKLDDKIVGAGSKQIGAGKEKIPSDEILEVLAKSEGSSPLTVQVLRTSVTGVTNVKDIMEIKLDNLPDKPFYAQWLQDAVGLMPRDQAKKNQKRAVVFIILVMAGVTTVRCFARFNQNYMSDKVVQISIAGLREKVFEHVMHMPVGFFSTSGTSDTTSRIVGDISGAGNGIKTLLGKALREPFKAMATFAGALYISWKLSLIFLLLAPVTVGLLGLLGRQIKKATKRSLVSSARMLGQVQSAMNALRVVKVYNMQDFETDEYRSINRRFLRQVLRVSRIDSATGPIMEVLGMVAGSAALLVGIHWIFSESSNMQPSSFFTLLVLLGTTAESVRKSSDVWNKIQKANAAAERVFAVVDSPREHESSDAVELRPLEKELEFVNINFTYPGSSRPVISDLNLRTEAGKTIAVVGPNGSGKTTLVNLIPRFYDPDSGQILIDGQDIANGTLQSLRSQISMVTQNVVTFNDTIAANIAYGRKDASIDEIIEAAKKSFSHEFIEPLPDGYQTVIGEQNAGFSGGQLQRIIIARAILKDPSILILDEAMSQVDADSESRIHEALSELMKSRTCFIIAHRFSTVISADSIVVMDNGQIISQGTHKELIEDCTVYKSLYETQLVGA